MTLSHRAKHRIMRGAAGLSAVLFAAATALPATAHHSFAMYNMSKEVTFTGKMTRFVPGANHAQLFFTVIAEDGEAVIGEDGKPVVWGVETGPAARIAQRGVTVDNFPVGTVINITMNPLRDGRQFGSLVRGAPIVKCGDSLPEGGCTPETGESFLAD